MYDNSILFLVCFNFSVISNYPIIFLLLSCQLNFPSQFYFFPLRFSTLEPIGLVCLYEWLALQQLWILSFPMLNILCPVLLALFWIYTLILEEHLIQYEVKLLILCTSENVFILSSYLIVWLVIFKVGN